MVVEKKYQVAISKNAKGEIIECLDCEIVGGEKYKAYKKECAVYEAKEIERLEKELEQAQEEKKNLESRLARQNLIIAKTFFDNEVAVGKCETTERFEDLFDGFIYHHIAFDLADAPAEYKAILERLG